ncbi:MAG: class I tRNA ligase family protein [Candidatus Dojkabacteria bacterium]
MLPKGPYNATKTEEEILKFWLDNPFYKPEYDRDKGLLSKEEMEKDARSPFCIINPPPNAYSRPHIGNVSGFAYQDAMLRYQRILGKKVLGQPGRDHAGIQGEVLVEKIFLENKKKSKADMGREKFYKAAYAHFEKLRPLIVDDEKRIGLSSDYDRDLFTLDPKIVDTVLGTFLKMFDDNMVYKGVRIVNWDPVAQTTLADIDTERVERESQLIYINYPLKEADGDTKHITVATTRPETMLGDTAVVVDPKDKRYKHLIGQTVILPLVEREIPIISSGRIEMEFGTGALKLTPSHAYEDYVIMNEWNSEQKTVKGKIGYVNVIDKDAKMTGPIPGKYIGMTTEDCRKEVVKDLGDLVIKTERITQRVMIGERSKAVIEQIMSSQWFIDVEKLKKPAIDVVKSGRVHIHPDYMKKKYLNWMENLHDWPVSRSLWWGYRIPVWYKGELSEHIDENGQVVETIDGKPIAGIYDAAQKGLARVQTDPPGITLTVIRHGETDDNKEGKLSGRTDLPLNESGKTQAEQYSESGENKYDIVLTSPLKRSIQTAEIIAEKLGAEVEVEDLLIERDFGEAEGLTWDEFANKHPDLAAKNHPNYQPYLPSGESIEEVETRVEDFIEKLIEEYEGKNILVVAHVGIIRILKRKLWHVTPEESRKEDANNLEELKFNIAEPGWIQDNDVFDTWFSSGQWPYATLTAHDLMDTFYPSHVMETAYDILELWVSRMIMLGIYTQGEIPFEDVYLHGLVKAPDGQKMSKSRGNVVMPDDIINKYGADALRLMYIVGNKAGAGYPISYEKLEGFKRFLNKIWNAGKFALTNLEGADDVTSLTKEDLKLEVEDKEVLDHISKLCKDTKKRMDKFLLGVAAQELYESFWHTFADIYLEKIKTRLYTKDRDGNEINASDEAKTSRMAAQWTLYHVYRNYMILLHPFIPFITERVWKEFPKIEGDTETIMYARWPYQAG